MSLEGDKLSSLDNVPAPEDPKEAGVNDENKPLNYPKDEKEKAVIKSAVSTAKRQLTLGEMMGSTTEPTGPATKKQKISKTATTKNVAVSSSVNERSKPATHGLQPLNSIPFSMSAYKESLTEEQLGLLALECETMGKSWCVRTLGGLLDM